MGRRGQPAELAPSYVFLASYADSSYITGQVNLHLPLLYFQSKISLYIDCF